ncbi:TonB-dependent receptor [Halpernia frigidisoli]|uniref:Iron complex outermembrane recepter protein n=1 Tax=Halpernia frigidisoli TaxID=1125876 RepID=A0A1I3FMB1_9FLAO|nr:TonB-dependent receptor plug domain-containing protein [Halpernia frigidisoli]SFI12405.1 iron complex outermembrane recepter protein [Halpernia frigidisoli]
MKSQLFLGAVLASSFAMAQNQEKSIDTVQVMGRNKLKHERAEFKRHAQSTETLGIYELNRNNSAFLEQSLSTMSGVQVDKRTALGGQRVVVRGYGNDQKFNNWGVKFYLNSVPITNADNTTTLEGIDFSLINSVEVIKGPAGTMYGSGVGGVVRFYMRPETEKGVTVSQKLAAGSFKLLQSATRVDAVGDDYSVMFNYSHLQSDGYRVNGSSLRNDYAFLGNFQLNPKESLSVYASQNYSHEGVSGQISYPDYYAGIDNGNTAYIRKNSGNKFATTRASVTHNYQFLPNFSNMTSIFYTNLDANSVSAGALGNTVSPNYGFRSTFHLKNKIDENFKNDVEFGAEYMQSRSIGTSYRFTGSITNPLEVTAISGSTYARNFNQALSFFAIDKLTYNPWDLTLVAGLSGNNTKYSREDLLAVPGLIPGHKDNSFSKNYGTVYTPHIALQKVFMDQIFNLSYSEGYNAPTSASSFIATLNVPNDNLKAERAKMWDFSIHGLLSHTRFDYQISAFRINVRDKLTQLSSLSGTTAYTYFANTGDQRNQGLELSMGYVLSPNDGFLKTVRPFANYSYYDFKYTDFKTIIGGVLSNFDHKTVVGVPRNKLALGLDFDTNIGLYLNNTFSYLGNVYTDFANTNLVKGYTQYNAKLGYKMRFGKFDFDVYAAGNNLTSQINYTFLFLGNSINDSDTNSNYPGQKTDINPGPSKAYFFGGANIKYHF